MEVTCARNSSPSIPGIFTSVTMHMASRSPGHARAASAEEKTSTAHPRSPSICPMECRAASSSSITTMVAPLRARFLSHASLLTAAIPAARRAAVW